jgi:hypothetical protein
MRTWVTRRIDDSGTTQNGPGPWTTGPKRDARGGGCSEGRMDQRAIDCRQPRYPQEIPEDRRFCAPALRTGLPLSAIGRTAAVNSCELDRRRMVWPAQCPPSRGRRRPVRRGGDYRHAGQDIKGQCVANRGQYSSALICRCPFIRSRGNTGWQAISATDPRASYANVDLLEGHPTWKVSRA